MSIDNQALPFCQQREHSATASIQKATIKLHTGMYKSNRKIRRISLHSSIKIQLQMFVVIAS